ncbi:hypothetical protein V3C99_007529 [Haemonchus contortus]
MYMHSQCIILCMLVACGSSNLFVGRMSTRPSAGKRSTGGLEPFRRIFQNSESLCSPVSVESGLERIIALQRELDQLSSYLAVCGVRTTWKRN